MGHSNSELAEAIARLSFLLGYVRVANSQRLAQVERQIEQVFQYLCSNGLEEEARELRQTSERMGYSMGLSESPPQWIMDYQRELIRKISEVG